MTAAPYTPQTLAFIREQAPLGAQCVAHSLDWPLDRTLSIAQKHGIELRKTSPQPPASEPEKPIPPPALCLNKRLPGCIWNPEICSLTTPRGILDLSMRRALVFDVLFCAATRLSGPIIARCVPTTVTTIAPAVCALNAKLPKFGLIIDGERGSGGGYLLVKLDGMP